MTIEEKAKAYDEALELARDYYKANLKLNNADENLLLEDIFPELKESVDEMIKKALVRFHKSTIDIDGIKGADILAWLEKQGEQNFTDNKEKLDLLNFIRKETGCGLAEANNALLKLIKVLKQHPLPIMDKPRKLKIEWKE